MQSAQAEMKLNSLGEKYLLHGLAQLYEGKELDVPGPVLTAAHADKHTTNTKQSCLQDHKSLTSS